MAKRLWRTGPLEWWTASAKAFGAAIEYQSATYVRGWRLVILLWDRRFVVRLY